MEPILFPLLVVPLSAIQREWSTTPSSPSGTGTSSSGSGTQARGTNQ